MKFLVKYNGYLQTFSVGFNPFLMIVQGYLFSLKQLKKIVVFYENLSYFDAQYVAINLIFVFSLIDLVMLLQEIYL